MAKNRNEAQFERYRQWQWIKHTCLGDYIGLWAVILGSFANKLFVFDPFAGAATYNDAVTGKRTDGSPVIFAVRAKQYCERHPGKSMHVICAEQNPNNHAALSERMKGFGDLVTVLPAGDFALHVPAVHELMKDAPALIHLDPIGLKTIPASVCQSLTHRTGKTDLFIVLHFGIVHRTTGLLRSDPFGPKTRKNAANLDAVFNGGIKWRTVAAAEMGTYERERALLDIYFADVLGSRFPLTCAYPVRARFDSPPKYWLVQASASPKAFWLMNDEIVKLDELLYERTFTDPEAIQGIVTLENEARRDTYERELQREMLNVVMAAGVTTFGRVRDQLVPEFFGRVKQGAYAKAAKALVKDGAILREKERASAKLEDGERLSVPRNGPSVDHGRVAAASIRAA